MINSSVVTKIALNHAIGAAPTEVQRQFQPSDHRADIRPYGECDAPRSGVEFRPAVLAKRQVAVWRGLTAEVVQLVGQERFESSYCGPYHLLVAYERAARHEGESVVEGLPHSTTRDFSRKLTLVPAGHRFSEWQEPRAPMRATYFRIDPQRPFIPADAEFGAVEFAPRLFFENALLWQTAVKLTALIEAGPSTSRLYAEALCVVLVHELLRIERGTVLAEPLARGGLAGWQRRAVAEYLEEHLGDQVSLATLAGLAQLSPYHFSRAFKRSFGMPPHRYHTTRRIERAKTLLADRDMSVTAIAMEVGFAETSSFTAAFRRIAGRTPSAYRRSLF
jgi:AraC family transcriptional regulator